MPTDKYHTFKFWNKYLQELGFKRDFNTPSGGGDYYYYHYGNYIISINKADLDRDTAPFFYIVYSRNCLKEDKFVRPTVGEVRAELCTVLKAITNPDLMPLCAGIDWAEKFTALSLQEGKEPLLTGKGEWGDFLKSSGWLYNKDKSFETHNGLIQMTLSTNNAYPNGVSLCHLSWYNEKSRIWESLLRKFRAIDEPELQSLLKALAKPELLPLCLHIEWASSIVGWALET